MLASRLRLGVWSALLLGACASTPTREPAVPAPTAAQAASYASDMVGRPYRRAGRTPRGFDCSGLVHYSFARAGVQVAHDTQALLEQSAAIGENRLRRGDLLFFDEDGKKRSHVGIYLGDRRFVHAPSSGGRVRVEDLDSDYWRKHFVEARRL
jgi:cell wall-associated NlpC family hydrolase